MVHPLSWYLTLTSITISQDTSPVKVSCKKYFVFCKPQPLLFFCCFTLAKREGVGYNESVKNLRCKEASAERQGERIIMEKIQMTTPLVEMDGDEMTRILWADDQGSC